MYGIVCVKPREKQEYHKGILLNVVKEKEIRRVDIFGGINNEIIF